MVVHGIGEEHAGYSAALRAGIERAMRTALNRCLPHPLSSDETLFIAEEAQWDRYVSPQQAALRKALQQQIPRVVFTGLSWRLWWGAILSQLILRARARAVPFIGDILAYQRADAQHLIHSELDAALARLATHLGTSPTPPPLTIVAHSLGTVIASDFLWDRWMRAPQRLGGLTLRNFFTMGSPMAFYALKYGSGRVEQFEKPITIAPPGCWVNIFHIDDPVATALRPLNQAYADAVLQDAEIRNAALLGAHTSYWSDSRVHEVIGHKLALDWIESHHALPAERLTQLRQRYARRLALG